MAFSEQNNLQVPEKPQRCQDKTNDVIGDKVTYIVPIIIIVRADNLI